ncbi:MAG TPA: BON domain-containing protein [Polyangiaceae bacterium]|nr:BON domain-containing protein [Polyangiaceae bacterium]
MYGWSGWWFIWPLLWCLVIWLLAARWSPASYPRGRGYSLSRWEPWGYGGADGHRGAWPWSRRTNQRGRGPGGYRRSDERITEDVSDALMVNEDIDATGISVRVEQGVVVLSGYVASRSDKRLAEDVADSVPGVLDVRNELRIGTAPSAGPPAEASPTEPPNPTPA